MDILKTLPNNEDHIKSLSTTLSNDDLCSLIEDDSICHRINQMYLKFLKRSADTTGLLIYYNHLKNDKHFMLEDILKSSMEYKQLQNIEPNIDLIPMNWSSDIEYVSCDLFDTLLMRNCVKFSEIRKQLNVSLSTRENLETAARNKYKGMYYTIEEIYADDEESIQLEKDLEMENIYVNVHMLKFIKTISKRYKIIFTSDTYFTRNFLKQYLKDIDYVGIFLSCEIKKSKENDGEMFEYICKEILEISPSKILHIGDNYTTDCLNSIKNGLCSYNLINYTEEISNYTPFNDIATSRNINWSEYKEEHNPMNNELLKCAHQVLHNRSHDYSGNDQIYRSTILTSAPIIFHFTSWILDVCMKSGINSILFCARDCHPCYKLAQLIIKHYKLNITAEYIRISRQITHFIGYEKGFLKEENLCKTEIFLDSDGYLTSKQICNRLHISEDQYLLFELSTGVKITDDKLSSDEIKLLKRKLFLLEPSILGKVKKLKDICHEYLLQHIENFETTAIVDIGWNGSCSKNLSKAYNVAFKSIYFGLRIDKPIGHPNEKRISYIDMSCVYKHINNIDPISEIFLTEKHGTCIGYEKINGIIQPICSKNDCKHMFPLNFQTKAYIDYCQTVLLKSLDFDTILENKVSVVSNYISKLVNPTDEFKTSYGFYKHSSSTMDETTLYMHDLVTHWKIPSNEKYIYKCQKTNVHCKKVAVFFPFPFIWGSGGHKTIISLINLLQKQYFFVDIYTSFNQKIDNELEFFTSFHMLDFTMCNIIRGWQNNHIHEYDLVVATFWESVQYVKLFRCKKLYFVQDIEFLFYSKNSEQYLCAQNTYSEKCFTFLTIGNYLKTYIQSVQPQILMSKLISIPFTIEKTKYINLHLSRENSICLLYQPEKPRRDGKSTLQVAEKLAKLQTLNKVFLFGSDNNGFTNANRKIHNLGILSETELVNLYNTCKSGFIVQYSNPSRIPFEMLNCHLPVVTLLSKQYNSCCDFDFKDMKNIEFAHNIEQCCQILEKNLGSENLTFTDNIIDTNNCYDSIIDEILDF